MGPYILRRILFFIPTLLGVILTNFLMIQLVPGGPVEQFIAKQQHLGGGEVGGEVSRQKLRQGLDQEQVLELKKLYGFDKPLWERLLTWTWKLLTFQFGESYFHHKSVLELVVDKFPVSISLGIFSFFLTYTTCIPLGIAKAVRKGTTFDFLTSFVVFIGYSIPGFVLGVLLILLFGGGSYWDVFPIRGLVSDNFATLSTSDKILDYLHHLVLPLICLNIGSFAVMTSLTKNTVIDCMEQMYVLTAKAKGLSYKVVLYKHIFRNTLIPLVTGFAGNFLGMFFAGSLLIETLFSLDGLGLLSFNSVMSRDYPVVMATQYFFALLFVVGNLISDIMYVIVDPRINFDT